MKGIPLPNPGITFLILMMMETRQQRQFLAMIIMIRPQLRHKLTTALLIFMNMVLIAETISLIIRFWIRITTGYSIGIALT